MARLALALVGIAAPLGAQGTAVTAPDAAAAQLIGGPSWRDIGPGFTMGGGPGGFGGGGAPLVESGDHRVTRTAGGRTTSQVLRVEKLPSAEGR